MSVKTPSQVMMNLIQAAMSVSGLSVNGLAGRMQVHPNTVRNDIRDPDKIPQSRLWLYFAVLGIPIQDSLNTIAENFAHSIAQR